MGEYSVDVDWRDEWEDWNMIGRDIMYEAMMEEGTPQHIQLIEEYGEDHDLEEIACESADSHIPMMNYAYPLETCPDQESIIKVCEETACTVVEKESTGEYFLALCGGGMDLSQDVALAYIIADTWLPISLISQVSKQRGLSKGGEKFDTIKAKILEQTQMEIDRLKSTLEEWKDV